jgi:radical SAM protein with 4Fe4S-binding SPASM domain
MAHVCNAGCQKLVIRYDGYIIPCEAFKGLTDQLPELVLGHISEPDALSAALERARAIPWLTCFQESARALTAWERHHEACLECSQEGELCRRGADLLWDALREKRRQLRVMNKVRSRLGKPPLERL